MSGISKHLGEIILAIAAVALLVGIVLSFASPIGSFFFSAIDTIHEEGNGKIWNYGSYDGTGSGGSNNAGETTEAGLYETGSNYTELKHSWEELIDLGYITVTDRVITTSTPARITGDLMVSNEVTAIGTYAFNGCTGLTGVAIPNSVTTLSDSAFYGCTYLTSVTFGANSQLATISNRAFYNCTNLTGVSIPAGVTTLGDSAFERCTSLGSVTFGANSQLATIGNFAFRKCTNLTSIDLPDSVTTIGKSVFENCTSLTSIEIPASVTTIGDSMFYGCSGLASVTFGANSQLTSTGNSMFYNCSNLTSVTFGANSELTTIGGSTFENCTSLTSIEIPSNVTTIGTWAFFNTSLTSITFENPNGWYVTTTSGAASGTDVTLTDTTTNATYLTSTYKSYYWYRK